MAALNHEKMIISLHERFINHPERHSEIEWNLVQERLEKYPDKLRVLNQMEESGGEPDVVGFDPASGAVIFMDCSPESPRGRRSLCYDREALDGRKKNKPDGSALDLAAAMGIEILNEEQYRQLQEIGEFDQKTSSWVETPSQIRELGGALFCDRRYGQVFTYHNGAESYYAARGFRGKLTV